jgi:hypothetical protein
MGRPRKRSEPIVTAATRWLGIHPAQPPLPRRRAPHPYKNAVQRKAGGHAKTASLTTYMAAHRREPDLTGDQRRRALALLASIPYGITEEVLVITHGFDRDMIACLVDECLATAEREVVVTGPGRAAIEVVRIRITDAGRQALKD